ncbi:cyclin-dependent kinase inhibitor 1C-like [Triticum dicoccoides]|nr:cyclin-dependent kinase inhibitor 1C-like [Triticum dicoccoides]
MASGGTWKSERAPVDIWGASRIAGTRQNLSFIIKGPEGEDLRSGYIAQEFALAGHAGRLAGGDQLVLTKVYFTRRGEEAVSKAKERVMAKAKRKKTAAAASSSSRAPLPPAAVSSPAPGKTPAPVAAYSPAPGKTPAPAAATSPAPPKKADAPSSSSPALIDQAVSDSSAGGSTSSTRLLLLEVGDSPVSQAQDFSIRHILRAAELVGSSLPLNKRKPVPFSCDGLFLLQEGPRKKFPSSP